MKGDNLKISSFNLRLALRFFIRNSQFVIRNYPDAAQEPAHSHSIKKADSRIKISVQTISGFPYRFILRVAFSMCFQ